MHLESAKLRHKNNRNFQLLLLAALYLIVVILPAAFDLSAKIPEPGDLQTASIKVTAAQSTLPNITGQISPGATASFSFAQSTMLLPIGKVLYASIPSQSIDLIQGCSGSIASDTTRNLFYPKNRIWEMTCGSFHLTMDQSIRYFKPTRKTGYIAAAAESSGFLVLLLVIYISGRKSQERLN